MLIPFVLRCIPSARPSSLPPSTPPSLASAGQTEEEGGEERLRRVAAAEEEEERKEKKAMDLGQLVRVCDMRLPHDWYPYARLMRRKIIYHGGRGGGREGGREGAVCGVCLFKKCMACELLVRSRLLRKQCAQH
jgi:hypothetical protein